MTTYDRTVSIVKDTLDSGGGTYDAIALDSVTPRDAWVVGGAGIPTVKLPTTGDSGVLVTSVLAAFTEALTAGADYVGTWHDGGIIHVDGVSLVEDLGQAFSLAYERGEEAIYNLESGVTLRIER